MIDIHSLVHNARRDYRDDTIDVVDGFEFSQSETLNLIDLMVNSKFESGEKDDLDRDKPFLNIVKSRLNVSVRATDLDTKDIQIKAGRRKDYWKSFLLGLKLKEWMKKAEFAKTTNRLNELRGRYGSSLAKRIMVDGKMEIEAVSWHNLIVDPTDMWSAPIIQRHYYSPAQLRNMVKRGWDSEMIEDIIECHQDMTNRAATVVEENRDENKSQAKLIEIYEVHGELPNYLLEEDSEDTDDTDTSIQMHIIHLEDKGEGDFEGRTLYSGEEEFIPYMKFDWDEQDGRTLSVGVVEDLFEAQIWTNYTVHQAKNMNDLASKIVFQKIDSEDEDSDATNLLTETETGDVLEGRLAPLQTNVGNYAVLQNVIETWKDNSDRLASTFEAKTGETLPSGTPFRQAAILNQEANSHFSYRREGFALQLKKMIRDWVIPYLMDEIEKDVDFAVDLQPNELQKIDDLYARHKANKKIVETILEGNIVMPQDYEAIYNGIRDNLEENGMRRFLQAPSDFTDTDSVYEVDIIITGEQENKAVQFESLSNILSSVVSATQQDGSNPYLDDPILSGLFTQIVEGTGVVSPLSLYRPRQRPPDRLDLVREDITSNTVSE